MIHVQRKKRRKRRTRFVRSVAGGGLWYLLSPAGDRRITLYVSCLYVCTIQNYGSFVTLLGGRRYKNSI